MRERKVENGLSPVASHAMGRLGSGGQLVPQRLTRRQKAAIIVRLLLSEGASLPLDQFDDEIQTALTRQMGQMRLVDRETLRQVVAEFVDELDAIGLAFPPGLEGALGMLDGHISAATAARLRREAGVAAKGDPWERIAGLETARIVRVLEEESVEIGAVLLSKLGTKQAAELLAELPGERARRLSYAISKTGTVEPETVKRIGLSLAAQLDAEPVPAFQNGPVQRVGAILNSSRAAVRDEVLTGLDEEDKEFADEVRRAIFTFGNIPERVSKRDVPRILRIVEPADLVVALAYAASAPATADAAEYVLANISKRMADQLRDEIAQATGITDEAGEEAMSKVVAEIRALVDAGELLLLA